MEQLDYYEKCLIHFRGEASEQLSLEVLNTKETDEESKRIFEDTKLLFEGFKQNEQHKAAKKLIVSNSKTNIYPFRLAIAAAALLVGLFAFLGTSKTYFPSLQVANSVLMSNEQNSKLATDLSPQEFAYQQFILGKSYYETQEFDQSILAFEKSLAQENLRNQLIEANQWYLCAAYLRSGKTDQAQKLFNELISLDNPKFEVSFLTRTKIRFQLFLKTLF